jgi:F420-dependent oxidoreductase-like protein
MKLGLALETWRARQSIDLRIDDVRLAERVGFDSVWTAEAYGADAITPLAYLAASTSRIRLGTSVAQISARTPTATAMAFATLAAMAGPGRVIAGVGVSGPQVVEGWYGQPWARPVARTRDYMAVMRKVFERAGPLTHDGHTLRIPFEGEGATGMGKPLKSILRTDPTLPIFLGAGGPANVALAAEMADGWLSSGLDPWNAAEFRPHLEAGARRSGRRVEDLEIHASTWATVTNDVKGALGLLRRDVAFYVGGMGAKRTNFHRDAMTRRGYGDAARRVQELFLAGRREEAVAAVPEEYCDRLGLFGPPSRIRRRFAPWAECGITILAVRTDQPEAIELLGRLAT